MAWFFWITASVFYAYQFALRITPSVLSTDLIQFFGVTTTSFGLLGSFYYYGYAFFQIPAGALLDRWGNKCVLGTSAAFCALGSFLFIMPSFYLACLGRILIGIGSAASFLGCIKIATEFFKAEQLAMLSGLSVFIGTSGAILGGGPLAIGAQSFGWKNIIWFTILIGVILTLLIIFFFKPAKTLSEKKEEKLITHLLAILKNRLTWWTGFYGILAYVPLAAFADLWGVPFLKETCSLNASEAASLVSIIYVGLGVGAPLAAFLPNHIGYRKSFMLCSALSTTLFVILLTIPLSFVGLTILMLSLGLALSPQILAFAFVCQFNTKDVAATASGLHNTFCMLSGVIMQPLVGTFVSLLSCPSIPLSATYTKALWVIPACLVLSIPVAWRLKK